MMGGVILSCFVQDGSLLGSCFLNTIYREGCAYASKEKIICGIRNHAASRGRNRSEA